MPIHEITETIKPVLAERETDGVGAGNVLGLHQVAIVQAGDEVKVVLDLTMAVGAENPGDRIDVEGDPPVHLAVAGGFHGDRSTIGCVVNAIPFIVARRSGTADRRHAPPLRLAAPGPLDDAVFAFQSLAGPGSPDGSKCSEKLETLKLPAPF